MKEQLLRGLAAYPLCDFFLQTCVETMDPNLVAQDLNQDAHLSLLQYFDKPKSMAFLEDLFAESLRVLGLTKEELKHFHEFNFDSYNIDNFESARGVLRFAKKLTSGGFINFSLLQEDGSADLACTLGEEHWLVEVKTLTQRLGELDGLIVDKHQPVTRKIADYAEEFTKRLVEVVPKARRQLLQTRERLGPRKTMVGIAINWFAAGFFLDESYLIEAHERLRGKSPNWEQDYLQNVDCLAFLIDDKLTQICN